MTVNDLLSQCMALAIIGCGNREILIEKSVLKLETYNGGLERLNERYFEDAQNVNGELPNGITPKEAAENYVVLECGL